MAKYLQRNCPRCKDDLAVVIPDPERKVNQQSVNGLCVKCGYNFQWKLIPGKRSTPLAVMRLSRRQSS